MLMRWIREVRTQRCACLSPIRHSAAAC